MKTISRITSLVLVCVLMLGTFAVTANAATVSIDETDIPLTDTPVTLMDTQVFSDVAPGSWYYDAVNTMAQNGLLLGYSDGLFHPDDEITYGQFATILCRVTGTPTESKTGENYLNANHWAAYAIQNILQTKIFVRNYKYADEMLWRAEAFESLTYLAQHMSKYNYSYSTQVTEKVWTWDNIPDANVVKNVGASVVGPHMWTWPTIIYAYNLGITTGTDANGTCNPTGTVTRAQLCQMLYNMDISGPNSVTIRGGSGIM